MPEGLEGRLSLGLSILLAINDEADVSTDAEGRWTAKARVTETCWADSHTTTWQVSLTGKMLRGHVTDKSNINLVF